MITSIYMFLSTLYLWQQDNEHRWLVWLKPLPILLLAGWASIEMQDSWLVAALLLSAAGDIALGLDNDRYFVHGLGFFLLAHVAYAVVFGRNVNWTPAAIFPLLIIFALSIWLLPRLLPTLGKLRIPVLCYVGVIILMSALGALHIPFSVMLAMGAIIFMVSDATIAFDKFVEPVPHRNAIVMTTYYLAQYLIVVSFTGV